MSLPEAILKEKLELYLEMIGNEIEENSKLIIKYENCSTSKPEVLEFFKNKHCAIKKEFAKFQKVLESL